MNKKRSLVMNAKRSTSGSEIGKLKGEVERLSKLADISYLLVPCSAWQTGNTVIKLESGGITNPSIDTLQKPVCRQADYPKPLVFLLPAASAKGGGGNAPKESIASYGVNWAGFLPVRAEIVARKRFELRPVIAAILRQAGKFSLPNLVLHKDMFHPGDRS